MPFLVRFFVSLFFIFQIFSCSKEDQEKLGLKKKEEEPEGYSEVVDPIPNGGDDVDVKLAKELLRPSSILGQNVSVQEVKSNLFLPKAGANGVTISWTSDNSSIISTSGTVTRPELGDADTPVKLTGVFSKGSVTDRKTFTVAVKAYSLAELKFDFVPQASADSSNIPSNTISRFYKSGSSIYVGTPNGLSISTDGGTTWVTRNKKDGLATDNVEFLAVSGNTILVGDSYTYHASISTDGGTTWRSVMSSVISSGYFIDGAINSTGIYLITTSYVYESTNNGLSWTEKTYPGTSLNAITASGTTLYLSTYDGLRISTNGGSSWTTKNTSNTATLPSNNVYTTYIYGSTIYVGTSSGLGISTDSATTFTTKNTGNGLYSNTVTRIAVYGTNVILSHSSINVSVSTNSGTSFSNYSIYGKGLGSTTYDVFADSAAVYVASSGGYGTSTDASTYSVTSLTSDFAKTLADMTIDSNNLYVTTQTKVFKVPLATNVATQLTSVSSTIYSVATDGTKLYLGANGALYSSSNEGTSFSTVTAYTGGVAYDIEADSSGRVNVASSTGLYLSSNSGSSFTAKTTSSGMAATSVQRVVSSGSSMLTLSPTVGVSISTNGGSTFVAKTGSSGLPSESNASAIAVLGSYFFIGAPSSIATYAVSSTSANAAAVFYSERGLPADGSIVNLGAGKKSLWVCTSKGLYVSIDEGYSFTGFDSRSGLPSSECDEVLVKGKYVFVSTSRGLARASW